MAREAVVGRVRKALVGGLVLPLVATVCLVSSAGRAAAFPGSLALPFARGETWHVCQGYGGRWTHGSSYALDLTAGSPCHPTASGGKAALAPAAGRVVRYEDPTGTLCINMYGGGSVVVTHVLSPLRSGAEVTKGQQIGTVAPRGQARNNDMAHLHLEVSNESNCPWVRGALRGSTPFTTAHGTRLECAPDLPPGGPIGTSGQGQWSGAALGRDCIPNGGRILTLDAGRAAWANDNLGMAGWSRQTDTGTTQAIAAGGNIIAIINSASEVWAKDGLASTGWAQMTPAGNTRAVAVGSTGRVMTIDACGAAWANDNRSMSGWTQQTGCGDTRAIAVGGSRMMIINGCGAAYAKDTLTGPWQLISDCGTTKAIAVGSSGRMMLVNSCDAAWASDSIRTGWTEQTPCGNVSAVAIGGSRLVILNSARELWGKDNVTSGGWIQLTPRRQHCSSSRR